MRYKEAQADLTNFHDLENKPHLAHAVVCKFDVSFWVQKHVVQFQISVDDSSLVKVVERQTNLCWVEPEKRSWLINSVRKGSGKKAPLPGMFLREFPLSLHVEHEITAIHIFNNKEKSVKRLKKKKHYTYIVAWNELTDLDVPIGDISPAFCLKTGM